MPVEKKKYIAISNDGSDYCFVTEPMDSCEAAGVEIVNIIDDPEIDFIVYEVTKKFVQKKQPQLVQGTL